MLEWNAFGNTQDKQSYSGYRRGYSQATTLLHNGTVIRLENKSCCLRCRGSSDGNKGNSKNSLRSDCFPLFFQ